MNKKLDNYLVEKYPKIFVNRYEDKKKTLMCFGFEHNDGWFWLIDQLCESIQNSIDSSNKYCTEDKKVQQVVADQVKEKFGGLRFYHSGGDTYIEGMISLAESMSYNICEFCGSTENVGQTIGWYYTICKECYDNSESRISSLKWKEKEDKKTEICKELRKIKLDKIQNEKY
jgi:virulence-associated protein VapD